MVTLSSASTPPSTNGTDPRQPSDRMLLASWRNGGNPDDFTELMHWHQSGLLDDATTRKLLEKQLRGSVKKCPMVRLS